MTNRTYNQFCPVAYSLDVIGDRWALLIVREMLFGPRRFSDLARGLPGIGANLLTERLRALEDAGVIAQRKLPPPAAAHVYELAPAGEELRPIIDHLVRWGSRWLQPSRLREDFLGPIQAMYALKILFTAEPRDVPLIGEVRLGEEVFRVEVGNRGLEVDYGQGEGADFVATTDAKGFIAVLLRQHTPQEAHKGGMVSILAGGETAFQEFVDSVGFASPTESR